MIFAKRVAWIFLFLFCGVAVTSAASKGVRPNILLILADDMGFSDVGCYGGEIHTPNIDSLAAKGIRFTEFYNGARCCPSRASLLTGLYAQQANVGDMVDEYARRARELLDTPAYSDHLNARTPTIAEVLRAAGYRTFMSGKWHLGYRTNEWPVARGFDRSFAVVEGAMNYYGFGMQHTGVITNPPMALDGAVYEPPREGFFSTDAFTDFAVRCIEGEPEGGAPFFMYLAYNAPHWPLQARAETVARYRGKYRKMGWDALRAERLARLKKLGIIDAGCELAARPAQVPSWESVSAAEQEAWDAEMSIYAAQVEEMDGGIGRVLGALKRSGRDRNTVVIFLSDNGGAAEDPRRSLAGAELVSRESYKGYGIRGAHVSCAPFRKTKKFTHEGGVATPLIVWWPDGLGRRERGKLVRAPGHIIDLMPTVLSLAGARFPSEWNGAWTLAPEGVDLTPLFRGGVVWRQQPIFWEHEGHRAVRDGKWKLVASHDEGWELYDMEKDRTELHNVAEAEPEVVRRLETEYDEWSKRVGVKPWPFPAKR